MSKSNMSKACVCVLMWKDMTHNFSVFYVDIYGHWTGHEQNSDRWFDNNKNTIELSICTRQLLKCPFTAVLVVLLCVPYTHFWRRITCDNVLIFYVCASIRKLLSYMLFETRAIVHLLQWFCDIKNCDDDKIEIDKGQDGFKGKGHTNI